MAYQSINPFYEPSRKTFENTTDEELEQTLRLRKYINYIFRLAGSIMTLKNGT